MGAISFHTALPKFNGVHAEVTAEAGTGDRYKLTGILNLPVSDHAAFRFAGSQQWFGGYWHNKLDGKQVGGVDESVLRGSFRADAGTRSSGSSAPTMQISRATG